MMRRLLFLALLAASLLTPPGPAQAQSPGDPTNRLSLEALTAPQPGDGRGGGYRRRSYGGTRRSAYRPASRYRRPYAGQPYGYGRRSVRPAYARPYRFGHAYRPRYGYRSTASVHHPRRY